MSPLIRRSLLALFLLSSAMGEAAAHLPPQADNWTEYSNHIGPDKIISIVENKLIFPDIGSFDLTFYQHFDKTDDEPEGDLYKISNVSINRNIDKQYRDNTTLGCGAVFGVGYVYLSEKVDPYIDKTLLHFSPVPGKDSPKMDDGRPYACLTSVWVSR